MPSLYCVYTFSQNDIHQKVDVIFKPLPSAEQGLIIDKIYNDNKEVHMVRITDPLCWKKGPGNAED